MTVLDLLEEIEDIVETASTVPLTNKIMIEGDELLEIVKEIRQSLPDDVQQAKWVRDEKERILAEAKDEYEKIIVEAKKQADYLVDEHDIVKRAQLRADETRAQADEYSKVMKMRTYEYLDKILYDTQGRYDDLTDKEMTDMFQYVSKSMNEMFQNVSKSMTDMFQYMNKSMESVSGNLQNNRDEIKRMAYETSNGEEA